MTEHNIAETVAELTRKAALEPKILKADDGREFMVLPPGVTKVDIPDEHLLAKTMPRFISANVILQAVESLMLYVNRFKGPDSMLFADIEDSSILGVMDYHSKSVNAGTGTDFVPAKVQRENHCCNMELPFSEEWKAWTAIDGVLMKQLDFARFLEENAAEVAAPSGADLLEVVRDIQALRRVNFIQAVRTASESENFEYRVESDATAKGVEIPTKFKLSLPVYFGEAPSELFAFLRWNIDEAAQLKLGIKLHRRELVRQAVFKQIVLEVADKTACPVVFGDRNE